MTGFGPRASISRCSSTSAVGSLGQRCSTRGSQVLIALLDAFKEAKIEFAYPTQISFTAAPDGTLIMPYPVEDGDRDVA